jgi:bile acid:Na+ symporter, BASS family
MNSIDAIKINFSSENLVFLDAILVFLMFSIALDIKLDDFRHLLQRARPTVLGLISQLILMPLVTFALIYIFQPPPSVALGMVAIAACPGGNSSNFATHIAGGNTALAITTTSVSVLVCVVTLPFYLWLAIKGLPNIESLNRSVQIEPLAMVKIVTTLILLPLGLGIFLNEKRPIWAKMLRKWVQPFGILLFVGLIVGALAANFQNIMQYVGQVFWVVFCLNALALAGGFYFARLNNLSIADAKAISFETGIHNVTLGLIVIFKFFEGLGGMALVAAWYGIWDLLTGFGLALWWKYKTPLEEA